jgi:ribose/xylose/arabinose/galactoside ABC-type transport system permease subunit
VSARSAFGATTAGFSTFARHVTTKYATELGLIVALGVLCVFFSVKYPSSFPTQTNVENMAQVGGILLVVAIGQMFAILIGGFDLSVAATMGFVGVVAGLVMTEHGGLAPGIVIGIIAGAAI